MRGNFTHRFVTINRASNRKSCPHLVTTASVYHTINQLQQQVDSSHTIGHHSRVCVAEFNMEYILMTS